MKQLPLVNTGTQASGESCCDDADSSCCGAGNAVASTPAPAEPGHMRSVMRIEGMDCASCAVTLERSVARVPGVSRAVVNFAAARLEVHHPSSIGSAQIEQAVQRAGFRAATARELDSPSAWRERRTRLTMVAVLLWIIGLALALAGSPGDLATGLFFAAILLAGWPILRAAGNSIRGRHLDMNVLMSAATVGAALIGEWAEAASVVVLFALGNALQVHAVARTRSAVASLAELAPGVALVRRAGQMQEVPVDTIDVGDHVIVRPGERAAIDGIVLEGATSVDEAPITGESLPVDKGVGDRVLSGVLNGHGSVVVRAERTARDSTLQQIVRLVEQAQASRAPAELLVDRFSRVYTPSVFAAAIALMTIAPLAGGDAATWVYRGLALLIIACPCSLVISTPVTVVSGIGAASRRGVLVKGGAALESAGRLRALAIDKTGTLTEGRPVLVRTLPLGDRSEREVTGLAAALERRSEHPLAHALLVAAADQQLAHVDHFASIPGQGAEGAIDGVRYMIGSPRLFAARDVELGAAAPMIEMLEAEGETPVLLGTHHEVVAVFGLADAIRPEAPAAIAALRASGVQHIVMLTGDSEGAARRVAEQLDIGYEAQLLPADKVAAVQRLREQHGVVGMVGDGVNDAPAMATATVSFAMGAAGSAVALESADIALMQDDLRRVASSVRLSQATERILRQNIAISLAVKIAFVVLAPFGFVALWLAVAADMGTSLAVTANGLRLFRRP